MSDFCNCGFYWSVIPPNPCPIHGNPTTTAGNVTVTITSNTTNAVGP